MDWPTLKIHILDGVKGFLGAMAAAAAVAGLQYMQVHLPTIISDASMLVAGVLGVKTGK